MADIEKVNMYKGYVPVWDNDKLSHAGIFVL